MSIVTPFYEKPGLKPRNMIYGPAQQNEDLNKQTHSKVHVPKSLYLNSNRAKRRRIGICRSPPPQHQVQNGSILLKAASSHGGNKRKHIERNRTRIRRKSRRGPKLRRAWIRRSTRSCLTEEGNRETYSNSARRNSTDSGNIPFNLRKVKLHSFLASVSINYSSLAFFRKVKTLLLEQRPVLEKRLRTFSPCFRNFLLLTLIGRS